MSRRRHHAKHGPDRAGRCDRCRKLLYRTRGEAQAVAKRMPGDHMTAYRCPDVDGCWHLGHLPADVRAGEANKHGYQARAAARTGRGSA